MNYESNIRVAVVVPVYNGEKYLRECLFSLEKQLYKNFNVFLVNDGSVDDSELILREFVDKDDRYILLNKSNGGVSSARNLALSQIEDLGVFDLICFLDCDDRVGPNYLSLFVDQYVKTHAGAIIVGSLWFDRSGVKEKYCRKEESLLDQRAAFEFCFSFGRFVKNNSTAYSTYLGNMAFDSCVIKGLRFDGQKVVGEDIEYKIKCLLKLKSVAINSEVAHFYRIRKTSLSHSEDLDGINYYGHYLNWLISNKDLPCYAQNVIEGIIVNSWWSSVRRFCNVGGSSQEWFALKQARRAIKLYCHSKEIYSGGNKKRFFLFDMGRIVIKLYFLIRKNKSFKNKYVNAFD